MFLFLLALYLFTEGVYYGFPAGYQTALSRCAGGRGV
jgi:hypothetical protein